MTRNIIGLSLWQLHDKADPHWLGALPYMTDVRDPRPLVEQLDYHYAHGGGWHDFNGFDAHIDRTEPLKSELRYPGDPPMKAIAYTIVRDEVCILFQSSWVAVTKTDADAPVRVCRMD